MTSITDCVDDMYFKLSICKYAKHIYNHKQIKIKQSFSIVCFTTGEE